MPTSQPASQPANHLTGKRLRRADGARPSRCSAERYAILDQENSHHRIPSSPLAATTSQCCQIRSFCHQITAMEEMTHTKQKPYTCALGARPTSNGRRAPTYDPSSLFFLQLQRTSSTLEIQESYIRLSLACLLNFRRPYSFCTRREIFD